MKHSVLIIAHNESEHIEQCLRSIFSQTIHPDEVILVAHNCTDYTVARAQGFSGLRIEKLDTEERGPIFARIRWFELASHEIIACIDGDAIADPNWLENITAPFVDDSVSAVGGMVWFVRDLWANLMSLLFFWGCMYMPWAHFYFWGANFACRKSAYDRCGGLRPFVDLRHRLGLTYWAEDCYLSLSLERCGRVVFCPDAVVRAYSKDESLFSVMARWEKQTWDRKRLFRYFDID